MCIRDRKEEPTDLELESMWDRLGLHVVKPHGSDLIEVYEKEQIEDAFNVDADALIIEQVYEPNKLSMEDAINAYFPE